MSDGTSRRLTSIIHADNNGTPFATATYDYYDGGNRSQQVITLDGIAEQTDYS